MIEPGSLKKQRKNPNDHARFVNKTSVTQDGEIADIKTYQLDLEKIADFSARPVYVRREDRIKAHFLICFLSLLIYRLLEKKLEKKYTCEEILDTLKEMNFADIKEQGFIPLYRRDMLTDALHDACGFRTDYQFISKSNTSLQLL